MTNMAHIIETALLLLAAYLLGCAAGYAVRRILHAGRGTRQVAPEVIAQAVAATPESRRVPSPAARLAATVDDLPPPPRPVVVPKPVVAEPVKLVAKPAITPPKPATAVPAAKKPAPAPASSKSKGKAKSADPKPMTLSSPRVGGADNLKQIKGIGPKIEASLHAMGIYHVDQIAGWNKANVDWVDTQLAFKGRIGRERWVEQALDLSKTKASA